MYNEIRAIILDHVNYKTWLQLRYTNSTWYGLSNYCKYKIKKEDFDHIESVYYKKEITALDIIQNNSLIRFVTDEKIILDVLEICGYMLRHVQKHLITYEMCLTAINNHSCELQYVPQKFRTYELYIEYVKMSGYNIEYVPLKYITHEMVMIALTGGYYSDTIKCIPEEFMTEEIALIAVRGQGRLLKHIPEHLRTATVVLAAVQSAGHSNNDALKYVPKKLRTREVILAAVQQDGYALQYLPEHLRTYEICLTSVQNRGGAIRYIPSQFLTNELLFTAIQNNNYDNNVENTFEHIHKMNLPLLLKIQTYFKERNITKYDKDISRWKDLLLD